LYQVSLPGPGESLFPPSDACLPALDFVLLRLLPAARNDETLPALELRLRAANLLRYKHV